MSISGAKIAVSRITNILDPSDGMEHLSMDWIEDRTAGQYAADICGPARYALAVNGKRQAADIVLKPGDHITVCPIPAGGDNSIFNLIASIAVLAAATATSQWWIANVSGPLGGTFGGALAGAAVGAVGFTAVNTLLPLPSPEVKKFDPVESSPNYGWGTPTNTWQEGVPLPSLIGYRRFAPPRIGGYRITLDDNHDSQLLRMQFALCDDQIMELSASSIWINERTLNDYPNVEFEYTIGIDGETTIPGWFEDTYTETSVNQELEDAETVWDEIVEWDDFVEDVYQPASPYQITEDVTAIGIAVKFPHGFLYQDGYEWSGGSDDVAPVYREDKDFEILLRWRAIGAGTWETTTWRPDLKYPRSKFVKDQKATFVIPDLASDTYEIGVSYSGDHGDLDMSVIQIVGYSSLAALSSQVTSGSNIDSLRVGLFFPHGLYYLRNDGGTATHSVSIAVAIRPYGDSEWTNCQVLDVSDSTRDAFRKVVEFKKLAADQWEIQVFFSGIPETGSRYVHTCYFEYFQEGIDLAISYQGVAVLSMEVPANEALSNSWPSVEVATKNVYRDINTYRNYFGPGYFLFPYTSYGTWNTTYNRYDSLPYSGNYWIHLYQDGAWVTGFRPAYARFLLSEDYIETTVGYEIDIIDSNSDRIAFHNGKYYNGQWVEFDWGSYDIERIKIVGQPEFSLLGIEFSDERLSDSSNPAAAAYHRMIDKWDIAETDIDADSFLEWEEYCYEKALTVSGYLDTEMSREAVKNLIEEAGRAVIQQRGSKFYAVIEDVGSPVQKFSSDNIKEGTFSERFTSVADLANTIIVYYYDRNLDYRKTPVKVRSADIDNDVGEKVAEHTLYWVDNEKQALAYATRMLKATQLCTRQISWQSDIDAINCSVGDVVLFQNDLPVWGVTPGRVVSSTSDTVTCDIPLDFSSADWDGRDLRIFIRHMTPRAGETTEFLEYGTIDNPYPNTDVVTFELSSGSWERNPVAGSLVAIGWVLGTESSTGAEIASVKKLRIVDIAHAANSRRTITAVEYYDDQYDDGTITALIPEDDDDTDVSDQSAGASFALFGMTDLDYIRLSWRGNAAYYYVFYRVRGYGGGAFNWEDFSSDRFWAPTISPSRAASWGSPSGYPKPTTWVPVDYWPVEFWWDADDYEGCWVPGIITTSWAIDISVKGSWAENFRPTQIRLTYYDENATYITPIDDLFLIDTAGNEIVSENNRTGTAQYLVNVDTFDINWQGYDMERLHCLVYNEISNTAPYITKIEFYYMGQWSDWRFLKGTPNTNLNIKDLQSERRYEFSVSTYGSANEDNTTQLYFSAETRNKTLKVVDNLSVNITIDQITLT